MSDDVLVALLSGQVVGRVERDRNQRLSFVYESNWREAADAFPLSLSLPLSRETHPHDPIEAFLWGLLPDNDRVLQRWGELFHVSPRNVFRLIENVGEDCAGAVQFVRPERLEELQKTGPSDIAWLDEAGVALRLRTLRQDQSAWRFQSDPGQFSLAGAQPKTALLLLDGGWGVPSGRMPTTHILKPPIAEFDGHAENEHLCLDLARELGLPAARSEVKRFDGEVAIVVERYDRLYRAEARNDGAPVLRLHQEDMCQALGLKPTSKYQSEGGPDAGRIVELLRAVSSRPDADVLTFVDALGFNWLIAGTDAHAKNYSLLHGVGGRVRLAPLYDLASALPYKQLDPQRLKLAMKLGGTYRLRDIARPNWDKLAKELRLNQEEIVARVTLMAERLPDAVSEVRAKAVAEGLTHPIVSSLAEALIDRSQRCARLLRG